MTKIGDDGNMQLIHLGNTKSLEGDDIMAILQYFNTFGQPIENIEAFYKIVLIQYFRPHKSFKSPRNNFDDIS